VGRHPQSTGGVGGPGPDSSAGDPADDDVAVLVLLADLGDRAHGGISAIDSRYEQHPTVVLAGRLEGGLALCGLDAQRHHHVGEHDPVGQRKNGERELISVRHMTSWLVGILTGSECLRLRKHSSPRSYSGPARFPNAPFMKYDRG